MAAFFLGCAGPAGENKERQHVTSDNRLDIDELMEGVCTVKLASGSREAAVNADAAAELLNALADAELIFEASAGPTPTPAPGSLLVVSFLDERGEPLAALILPTKEEMRLTSYKHTGEERLGSSGIVAKELWRCRISAEDGERIVSCAEKYLDLE